MAKRPKQGTKQSTLLTVEKRGMKTSLDYLKSTTTKSAPATAPKTWRARWISN